jgi:hypothetical protein
MRVLSPRHGASSSFGWRIRPPDKKGSCGQPTRGGPPAFVFGNGLTTHRKTSACYEMSHRASGLDRDGRMILAWI